MPSVIVSKNCGGVFCVCMCFVCEMYRYSCKDIQQTENIQYDCIHPHVVHTPEPKGKGNPMNKTTKENRQQQNNTPETTKQHDNNIDIGVWAVFDGHEGDDVSKWLSQNMEQMLMENIQKKPPTTITQMKNLIIRTFCHLDARIACNQFKTYDNDVCYTQHKNNPDTKTREKNQKEPEEAGSTAAVVLLYRGRLYVAHVGDSRVIVVHPKTGNIIHETLDMTAQNVKSKQHKEFLSDWKRIQRTGGVLEEEEGGLVYLFGAETNVQSGGENKRQSVGLMVTRAFGDSAFKSSGLLSSHPIVHSIKIKAPVYVVIASDGVWDTVNSHDMGKWIVECATTAKGHRETKKTDSQTSLPFTSIHTHPSPLEDESHGLESESKPIVFQRFFEERLRILDPDDNYTMMMVKVWPSKSV